MLDDDVVSCLNEAIRGRFEKSETWTKGITYPHRRTAHQVLARRDEPAFCSEAKESAEVYIIESRSSVDTSHRGGSSPDDHSTHELTSYPCSTSWCDTSLDDRNEKVGSFRRDLVGRAESSGSSSDNHDIRDGGLSRVVSDSSGEETELSSLLGRKVNLLDKGRLRVVWSLPARLGVPTHDTVSTPSTQSGGKSTECRGMNRSNSNIPNRYRSP